MKFKNAYLKYIEFVKDRQSAQSYGTLKYRFETKILPYFKDYDIYKIKEIDYLNWQHTILEHNYSDSYNKNLHYLVSGFFEYCVLFLDLKINIARKVGSFKKRNIKVEHDFYTLKEFKHFIKGFNNIIYKQFFIFMFFVGTRPGEAMALRFSDLNYCSISINKTISEHSYDGNRVIDDPKSLSSFRTIEIDKKLYNDLLKLKKYYEQKYNNYDFDFYIFGGTKPLAPTTINRYKKDACDKMNIRPIKLHEFRHSHASLLNSSNISIQQIKERLGHSNVNVTSSVYIHLTDKHKKRITRILNFSRLFLK